MSAVQILAGASLCWCHVCTSCAEWDSLPKHPRPTTQARALLGGGWFKVQQDGLDSAGVWGTERVINGKGIHKITIPKCIAPGQYLLRPEMLALHAASSYPGAQFYQECAQINVIGGTGAKTTNTVSLPGAYSVSIQSAPDY